MFIYRQNIHNFLLKTKRYLYAFQVHKDYMNNCAHATKQARDYIIFIHPRDLKKKRSLCLISLLHNRVIGLAREKKDNREN